VFYLLDQEAEGGGEDRDVERGVGAELAVELGGRLVEDDEAGAVGEGTGDLDQLARLDLQVAGTRVFRHRDIPAIEEVARLPLAQAAGWLEAHAHRQQGEFVLVLGAGAVAAPALDEGARVLDILLESLPASEAAKLAARITGAPRNALYKLALGRAK